MSNILPISNLRNYPEVIEKVSLGNPVFLTKNGKGAYVIMEIAEFEDYNKDRAALQLFKELSISENNKLYSKDEVEKTLRGRLDEIPD